MHVRVDSAGILVSTCTCFVQPRAYSQTPSAVLPVLHLPVCFHSTLAFRICIGSSHPDAACGTFLQAFYNQSNTSDESPIQETAGAATNPAHRPAASALHLPLAFSRDVSAFLYAVFMHAVGERKQERR